MIELRPYQHEGERKIREAFAAGFKAPLYVLSTGGGKCFEPNTLVLRYDGHSAKIKDIRVGDLLMGPDSTPRLVTGLGRGTEMMYRVRPVKGDPYIVNESHILSLKMTGNKGKFRHGEVVNIDVRQYLSMGSTFKHCAKGWRAGVQFHGVGFPPPIDPYILGLWLGDGHSRLFSVTTGDPIIRDAVERFASAVGQSTRIEQQPSNCEIVHVIDSAGTGRRGRGGTPLMNTMRQMRLIGNKHIPHAYKTASRAERLALLAGIIDTDGSWTGKGYELTLKSEALIDDVIFVVRSLGYAAYKARCVKVCGNNGKSGTYFRCHISGDVDQIPVLLERKKASPRRQKKNPLVTGITVEPIGIGEYCGVEISGSDRLFMLADFTVVHNTVTFSSIAHSAERRGRRVLIMCHRVELVEQIVDSLKNFDISPDIIAAGYNRGRGHERRANNTVAVASVQTLVRRLGDFAPPTLIICDEAHHCVGGNSWSQIMKAYPDARRLGVTATPCRLDGRGLGTHFDTLIRGPCEQELIDGGYLVRTRIFAPQLIDTSGLHVRMGDYVVGESEALMDKPAITGSAFSHYMQHTPNEQGLAFCTSVKHAENVAAQFRDGGVPALMVSGKTDKSLRRDMFRDYRAGKIRVLTAADIFSEGVDCPGAAVGIMLRPTQSLALYRQQKGRTMRPAPNKQHATLLDCVRNCERPGFELLPGEIDDWQLGDDAAKSKRKPPPGVKICPKCFTASSPQAAKCSNKSCDHVFVVKSREIDNREGEIHEITPEELAARAARRALGFEQHKADTPEKLAEVFRKKGFKGDLLGRARHVLAAREAKKRKEA